MIRFQHVCKLWHILSLLHFIVFCEIIDLYADLSRFFGKWQMTNKGQRVTNLAPVLCVGSRGNPVATWRLEWSAKLCLVGIYGSQLVSWSMVPAKASLSHRTREVVSSSLWHMPEFGLFTSSNFGKCPRAWFLFYFNLFILPFPEDLYHFLWRGLSEFAVFYVLPFPDGPLICSVPDIARRFRSYKWIFIFSFAKSWPVLFPFFPSTHIRWPCFLQAVPLETGRSFRLTSSSCCMSQDLSLCSLRT
jgi:hypothetical protein